MIPKFPEKSQEKPFLGSGFGQSGLGKMSWAGGLYRPGPWFITSLLSKSVSVFHKKSNSRALQSFYFQFCCHFLQTMKISRHTKKRKTHIVDPSLSINLSPHLFYYIVLLLETAGVLVLVAPFFAFFQFYFPLQLLVISRSRFVYQTGSSFIYTTSIRLFVHNCWS